MRKLCYTLSVLFLFFGCSTDNNLKDISSSVGESTGQESLSFNQKSIRKYIKSKKQRTRSSQEIKLIPHIMNGDTVCFIANYGRGWDVFSNDLRAPMVLMSSDEGCFYPGFTDNPAFDAFFDNTSELLSALKSEKHVDADTIDSSWEPYITLMNDVIPSDNPDYVYVYDIVKSESTYSIVEYTPIGGRLNTKWHQRQPYNFFIPEIYDKSDKSYKNGLAGCVGIAVSQYLYWHHNYLGIPEATVESALYNESSRTYTFSGNSSTVWNDFYDESKDSRMLWYFNEIKPTSIFIGYIAQKVKTRFGLSESSSDNGNMVSALDELLDDSYSSADGTIENIKKILTGGYPVLSTTHGGSYTKKKTRMEA